MLVERRDVRVADEEDRDQSRAQPRPDVRGPGGVAAAAEGLAAWEREDRVGRRG